VLPPGFRWLPGWLEAATADACLRELLDETPWEDPLLRVAGRLVAMPRRVAFYGPHAYRYSGVTHGPREPTPLVDDLRRRVEAEAGQPFNTVLLNLYRSGADSVSWHSDDDYPHGGHPAVASLSLGAPRRFRVAHRRRREPPYAVELSHGGLLVMEGRSQLDYRHALPRTRLEVGVRVNLTFRFMAASN
jgi:alkylated DNA repair dioxygenase AlkB